VFTDIFVTNSTFESDAFISIKDNGELSWTISLTRVEFTEATSLFYPLIHLGAFCQDVVFSDCRFERNNGPLLLAYPEYGSEQYNIIIRIYETSFKENQTPLTYLIRLMQNTMMVLEGAANSFE